MGGGENIRGSVWFFLFLFFTIVLSFFLVEKFKRGKGKKEKRKKKIQPSDPKKSQCPLCRSWLTSSEKIYAVSYPGNNEKAVRLLGCPKCYTQNIPAKGLSQRQMSQRVCPVCRKTLPRDGFVIGKMWKKEGKSRLHISGCTLCRPYHAKVLR